MRGLVIVAGWLYLHAPLLLWFGRTFSHTSFRLSAFLLVGALGLLVWRLLGSARNEVSLVPRRNVPALVIATLLAALGQVSHRWLDVQMLEAPLFLLGSWALLGLFATPAAWRRALVPALVFVSVLPFGAQADHYAGFMARVLSAKVAATVLGSLGVPSMSAETVLVFENGVAQIDAPCSGLRSLWMGAVVFLLAVWFEAKRLSVRVLGTLVLLFGLLMLANIVRVTLIVGLAVVLDQPTFADIVHVPLGLAGFVFATGIPLLLLHGARSEPAASCPEGRSPALSTLSVSAAVACMLIVGSLSSARPALAASPLGLELDLAAEWSPTPIALSSAETDLLARFSQGRVAKLRASKDGRAAAILLVESSSWRSHHPPELCLAGSGHELHDVREHELAPGFSVRFARLDEGQLLHVSWFQSGERTHADLLDRIFAQIFGHRAPFVLVSVVLEGFDGPDDPAFIHFLTELRAKVAASDQESP